MNDIFDHYGVEIQTDKLIEEIQELLIEAVKFKDVENKNAESFEKVMQEYADVRNLMGQFIYEYKMACEVNTYMDYKQSRQLRRIYFEEETSN